MIRILVSVDHETGTLARYVCAPPPERRLHLSHVATRGQPTVFTEDVVEQFRARPPEEFRVDTPPWQPPPGGSPTVARQARLAA